MIKKFIKSYALSAVMVLTFLAPTLVPAMANAASTTAPPPSSCSSTTANGVATGANDATGSTAVSCSDTSVSNGSVGHIAKEIVSLFSIIVGAVSIIMIIYGGFRYITSGGDSGRVGNAKNTLIYAIVGLVIVALAQLIVHFVLNQSNTIANPAATQ
jgi:hypothetical protein